MDGENRVSKSVLIWARVWQDVPPQSASLGVGMAHHREFSIEPEPEPDPAASGRIHELLEALVSCDGLNRVEVQALGLEQAARVAARQNLVCLPPGSVLLHPADPRIRDEVAARLDEWRAREWRGALVTALGPRPQRDVETELRRCVLAARSDVSLDDDRLAAAASAALALGRVDACIELGRLRLRSTPDPATQLVLATALSWKGESAEAEWTYAQVAATALPEEAWAELRIARAANLFWGAGDAERARAVLGTPTHPLDASVASAFRAFEGRFDDVPRVADREPAAQEGPDAALLWACVADSMVGALSGDAERELEASVIGLAAASRANSGHQRFTFFYNRVSTLLMQGYLHDAREVARQATSEVGSEGVSAGLADLVGARVCLAAGEISSAVQRAQEAVAALSPLAPAAWRFLAAITAARSAAEGGDPTTARAHLDAAHKLFGPYLGAYEPLLLVTAAWVEFSTGHLSPAATELTRALSRARALGATGLEFEALLTALRLACPVDGRSVARLAASLPGPLPRLLSMAVQAPRDESCAQLADRLGLRLLAAELRARRARGAPSSARLAQRETLTRMDYVHLPTIRHSLGPSRLTRREIEVSRLVSEGLSNGQIAQRLQLSIRTVETHVMHIRAKYGLANRRAISTLWAG